MAKKYKEEEIMAAVEEQGDMIDLVGVIKSEMDVKGSSFVVLL